jgi:iron complex outermembrane receptor protein
MCSDSNYLNIDSDVVNGLALPVNSPLLAYPNLPNGEILGVPRIPFLGTEANNIVELDTDSYSIFGQIDYDITDQWTSIFGLRVIQEEKDYDRRIVAFFNTDDTKVETATLVPGAGIDASSNLRTPFKDSTSKTLWAGKVQLD